MIIWSERMPEVLEVLQSRTYPEASSILSSRWGEVIDPEQLRGAVRRHARKVQVTAAREDLPKPRQSILEHKPVKPVKLPRIISWISIGAIGDTHLGSKYERNDILESLYDIYADEDVKVVYHTGNHIEGEARFNRNDIHIAGLDNQCRYFASVFPKREGIVTKFICGDDHEGWYTQREGVDIGQYTQDVASRMGRNDLQYIGYMEADDYIGADNKIRVIHPGGGSSYALSHTSQRILDSYSPEELPSILLLGHYHKASYLPKYRGVSVFQTGCTQEQTPFMRKKRLAADLGGWLIRVGVDEEGQISRVAGDFISFNHKEWKYR